MTQLREQMTELTRRHQALRDHHSEILRDHGKAIAQLSVRVADTDRDALRAAIGVLDNLLNRVEALARRLDIAEKTHAEHLHHHAEGHIYSGVPHTP